MKHIDLFSGIGGFALAVDTVWPNSEHIFCDNDPFCQSVLRKHWKNAKIYSDIRELTYAKWLEDVQGVEEQQTLPHQPKKLDGMEVIADLVRKLNTQNGEQLIKSNTGQEQKPGFKIDADKLLNIMERFASAVESQTMLSYPLTIKIMTDILSENSIPMGLYSQELLKTIIQIATRFFVTTATTQKLIWGNALIGPNSKIYDDIRTFTNTESRESGEQAEQKRRKDTSRSYCDILTGGFPCQPFSQAGRRKGTADDRYLWPEMFRVIREFHPTWVIAENVRGLVTWNEGLVLEQVCSDLESEGYEVQPLIIPAVAVNAPHRRDRVWFIANCRQQYGEQGDEQRMEADTQEWTARATDSERQSEDDTDTDTNNKRLEGWEHDEPQRHGGQLDRNRGNERWGWNKNWIEVATELCGMDDGLPKRLDRNPRLKALGNAIVPQIAEEIMRSISYLESLDKDI